MSERRVHSNTAWWIVGTACAVLLLLGLRSGATAYRRAEVIALVESTGGHVHRKHGARTWPRQLLGDNFALEYFGQVTMLGTRYQGLDRDKTQQMAAGLPLFPDLLRLGLESIELHDEDLQHVNRLRELRSLHLMNTKISSRGISYIDVANKIDELGLADTQVDDEGLRLLAKWPRLEQLSLDGTAVTDAGLVHLKSLKTLRHLSLSNTNVSDTGVADLVTALPELQVTDD